MTRRKSHAFDSEKVGRYNVDIVLSSNRNRITPYRYELMNFSFFLQEDGQGSSNPNNSHTWKYVVTGALHDRTILSDEMADLCAKFPIYVIKKQHLVVGVAKESKGHCNHLRQKT